MNEHVETNDHIPNHVEERYRLRVKLVSHLDYKRVERYSLTVNAVLTVKTFPWITYIKNPTTETKIGDKTHKSENKTEFIRAEICDGSAIVR